jgi:hypothetical protein
MVGIHNLFGLVSPKQGLTIRVFVNAPRRGSWVGSGSSRLIYGGSGSAATRIRASVLSVLNTFSRPFFALEAVENVSIAFK